jgi:hypothetical protein
MRLAAAWSLLANRSGVTGRGYFPNSRMRTLRNMIIEN